MRLKNKGKHLPVSFVTVMVVPLLLAIISGCSNVSYLSQATVGHLRIMHSRVPIERVLNTDHLTIEKKNKLKLVLEVRAYAGEELGLPKNKSYTLYSETRGKYLGWNVYAAPKFSVEPITWCFPIAGCVVYRGYFSKKKALAFARKMEEKDRDIFIVPFTGYSTLGWYDDPVLSSQLRLDTIHLAGLVIHELAHQKFYVPGDSRFNEAFAVTVERAGVLRWLRSTGRDALITEASGIWDKEDVMATESLKARAQLIDLYMSESNVESLEQKKISIFRDLEASLHRAGIGLPRMNGEESELNNAYLVPIDTYYSLVPEFQGMLDSLGGSLPRFFEMVETLGKLPLDKRQREIESIKNDLRNNQLGRRASP